MTHRRKSQVVVANRAQSVRRGRTRTVNRVTICHNSDGDWWWEYTRGRTLVCTSKTYRRVSDAAYSANLFANDLVDATPSIILYPDDYTPYHGWDGDPNGDKYD